MQQHGLQRTANSGNAGKVRSLPIEDWPLADRDRWHAACLPHVRLRRGGAAGRLKEVTRKDLARRYGYYMDFLTRHGRLDLAAAAGGQVTPESLEAFLAELQARVRSVTVYGTIYKLRRFTQLIAPDRDLRWLQDIENDLALAAEPQSKAGRLVLAPQILEAGLTLISEAEANPKMPALRRATQARNGLMIAMLACHPIRNKNFAALEIGKTFKDVHGRWWLVHNHSETKERREDERRLNPLLANPMGRYLTLYRPILLARGIIPTEALWLSRNDGSPLTEAGIAAAIGVITLMTLGINLSPHLFRTSAASTAAIHGNDNPHLASAVLNHRGEKVTERSYNYATSISAAQAFADTIQAHIIRPVVKPDHF